MEKPFLYPEIPGLDKEYLMRLFHEGKKNLLASEIERWANMRIEQVQLETMNVSPVVRKEAELEFAYERTELFSKIGYQREALELLEGIAAYYKRAPDIESPDLLVKVEGLRQKLIDELRG